MAEPARSASRNGRGKWVHIKEGVVLKPYDPQWPAMYEKARAELVACIGQHTLRIEHVGSTSIPGLAAKPTIDILVGVRDWDEAKITIAPLTDIGWGYVGEHGIPRRHYFRRGAVSGRRTHHLHMLEVTHPECESMLSFRNYLRGHPNAAADYERLKLDLARRNLDGPGYQEAKAPFIQGVLERARGTCPTTDG